MANKKVVKDVAIRVLVTKAEAEAAQAAASKDNRSLSAWIRLRIVEWLGRK